MTDLQARAEAAADAVAEGIYGPAFDPHLNPEAWEWCEKIAKAVLHALQSEGWRPISEAPRDGTQLLLFAAVPEVEGLSFDGPIRLTGYWDSLDEAWCSTLSTFHGPFVKPTHFMPLAAPPEGEGV